MSQYPHENPSVGIWKTWRPSTLLKRDSNTGVSCEYYEFFKNNDPEEHLQATAFA